MSEQNYNVEKILDHKPKSAKNASDAKNIKYLVKWEGFEEAENSWEPAENFNEDTLNEYWDSPLKKDDDAKISAEDVAKEVADDEEEVTADHEPEAKAEDKEYVVEAITGVKPRSAKSDEEAKEYNIKWEGYDDPKDKTYERAADIRQSAPDAVADFWKAKNADANADESDEEIEIKVSQRGRKIKPVVNPVVAEPAPPSKKKTKITPSKPKKRPSPVKKEKSPSSKLDEMSADEMNENMPDIVMDLRKRVNKLEANPQTDRQFIMSLGNRDDVPAGIKDAIAKYLETGNF